jgi:DNA-binding NarL/FixJ family response regulator
MSGLGILIVDNHRVMREGLKVLIDSERDMKVIGMRKNGREAIDLLAEYVPDVILMDVMMPDMNGMEATMRICEEYPAMRILALSMYNDRHYVSEMLRAGASGYLLKDCAFRELAEAIRTVAGGMYYLSPSISGIVVGEFVKLLDSDPERRVAVSALSPREREILQLIAEGGSTRDIASSIKVSVKTVETHRLHIMQKINAGSIAELTRFAIKEGLTSLGE